MSRSAVLSGIVVTIVLAASPSTDAATNATPIQIYGVWHAGNDACIWGSVRNLAEFDRKNHWIIDRGDGIPSVNLVILSFVQPLKLLGKVNDSQTVNGLPVGMTPAIVNYFSSHHIRVMLSIGGITYVKFWDQALAADATQLGLNASEAAQRLGVGIEIDYEGDSATSLAGLQAFIDAYRSVLPYDASGANPAARLTVDLAAGDAWLIGLAAKATRDWLSTTNPVLDYANAMVADLQPSAPSAELNWQEHIDGKPRMTPPIPPLAPAKLTGSLSLTGRRVTTECTRFTRSVNYAARNYVQTVAPNGAGTTPGMLGYMFWAAECPGTKTTCTTPPNTCERGLGAGSKFFNIPIPCRPCASSDPIPHIFRWRTTPVRSQPSRPRDFVTIVNRYFAGHGGGGMSMVGA